MQVEEPFFDEDADPLFNLDQTEMAALPSAVQERIHLVEKEVPDRVAQANVRLKPLIPTLEAANAFLSDGSKGNVKQRLTSLRNVANLMSKAVGEVSACRQGCSHCCHIPVSLSKAEAQLIGSLIGVKPVQDAQTSETDRTAYGYDRPCPFLEEGACSIYAHRPFACRALLNMDRDDLLCQLVEGKAIPVPYLNMSSWQILYVIGTEGSPLGDIRAFFPNGRRT